MTTTLHVLRVFTDDEGAHGNPLGVFLDGASVPRQNRQSVAARLGFSETVFVDDAAASVVSIFTPLAELPFAGHPLVGTAWLLRQQGQPVDVLRAKAGDVPTWTDDAGLAWIRGRAEWAPGMALEQHASASAVDALDASQNVAPFIDHWAWIDEARGLVRSRVFAPDVGIEEDEATGSAAVRLVTAIGQPITIVQGAGSQIAARPGPDGTADVGGRVVLDTVRDDAGL
jgi:predicted PhzF superfamily epimerase YddE/YHI9